MDHDKIDELDLSDTEYEVETDCPDCIRCKLTPFSPKRAEREAWEMMAARQKEWDVPAVYMVSNLVYKDLVENINKQKRLRRAKFPADPVFLRRQNAHALLLSMTKDGKLVDQTRKQIVPASEIKAFEKTFITPDMAEDVKKTKKRSYCYMFDKDKKPIGITWGFNRSFALIKGKKHDDMYYETFYVDPVKVVPNKENKLLKRLRDFIAMSEQI